MGKFSIFFYFMQKSGKNGIFAPEPIFRESGGSALGQKSPTAGPICGVAGLSK
jgi:hypothetical protein